jgi:hypothetical protein
MLKLTKAEQQTEPVWLERLTREICEWSVAPGPAGRGACLAAEEPAKDAADEPTWAAFYIAPPGVPLQLPETLGMLRQWRVVRVEEGELDGPVWTLPLGEALALAASQRSWIEDQVKLAWRHEEVGEHLSAARRTSNRRSGSDSGGIPTLANIDQRWIMTLTESASTFSSLLESLPKDLVATSIEDLARATKARSELRSAYQAVAKAIGREQAREVVVALLHARARTHSWRWTKWLGPIERTSQAERRVGREIDVAATGGDLLRRLAGLGLRTRELDDIVIDVLYTRSCGLRWRMTHPFRVLLGSHKLRSLRGMVRRRVMRGRQRRATAQTY